MNNEASVSSEERPKGQNQQVEGDRSMPSGTGKNPRRYLVPLLTVIILLIATISGFVYYYLQSSATISQNQNDIQSLQSQKSQLDSQVASLNSQNSSLKSQVDSLQSQLSSANSQMTSLNNQITSLNKQLSDTKSQMGSAQSTITGLQNTVNKLQAELKLYHDTGITVYSAVQPPGLTARGLVRITNNTLAHNPSWTELRDFILADRTDSNYFDPLSYTCGNFAEDVHNNAEAAGIKTAFVAVSFQNSSSQHALNAFVTTDRGLIYIDCGGLKRGEAGPANCDKTVTVKRGTEYVPQLIVPQGGWSYLSTGIVEKVKIYW